MLRSDSFNSTDTSFSASSVQSQELSFDMQSDLRKRVLKGRTYMRNSTDSNVSFNGEGQIPVQKLSRTISIYIFHMINVLILLLLRSTGAFILLLALTQTALHHQ